MKKITFSLILSLAFFTTQAQTPLEVIDSFFEALNSKDHVSLEKLCLDNLQLHSIKLGEENSVTTQTLSDFIGGIKSMPVETKIFEKISFKESLLTEHLAQFSLPYSFYVNDKLSHSGTNVITLLKTNEGWKISYIADTRKK
jgi:hypothetical protein